MDKTVIQLVTNKTFKDAIIEASHVDRAKNVSTWIRLQCERRLQELQEAQK